MTDDIKNRLGDYHHALSSEDRQIALDRIEELEAELEIMHRDFSVAIGKNIKAI